MREFVHKLLLELRADLNAIFVSDLAGSDVTPYCILFSTAVAYLLLSKKLACGATFVPSSLSPGQMAISWRLYFSRSTMIDIMFLLLNLLIISALISLGCQFGSIITAAHDRTVSALGGLFGKQLLTTPSWWLSRAFYAVALLLASDVAFYITHLACHRIPFLWSFHKVHHSSRTMTLFTQMRAHPVDSIAVVLGPTIPLGIITGSIDYWLGGPREPVLILGAPAAFVIFNFAAALGHSQIWWSWGPLDYLFCSPANHHLHHSANEEYFDKNFAGVFSLIDVVFGTFSKPQRRPSETFVYGVNRHDSPWDRSFVQMLCRPFYDSVRPMGVWASRYRASRRNQRF